MLRAIYTIILFLRDFVPLLNTVHPRHLSAVLQMAEQAVFILATSLLLASAECERLNLSLLRVWRPRAC